MVQKGGFGFGEAEVLMGLVPSSLPLRLGGIKVGVRFRRRSVWREPPTLLDHGLSKLSPISLPSPQGGGWDAVVWARSCQKLDPTPPPCGGGWEGMLAGRDSQASSPA